MVATITVVFAAISYVQFKWAVSQETKQLESNVAEYSEKVAELLIIPLWNIDKFEQSRILNVYSQADFVSQMTLFDEDNGLLGEVIIPNRKKVKSIERSIKYKDQKIGTLILTYTDESILLKQRGIFKNILSIYIALIVSCFFVIFLLVKRIITSPIKTLMEGINVISSGEYNRKLVPGKQHEVAQIADQFNQMASELEMRERSLKDHNENLKGLNEAILKIFSGSRTNDLIESFFDIGYKMVKYNTITFTIHKGHNANASGIYQKIPQFLGKKFHSDGDFQIITESEAEQKIAKYEHKFSYEFLSQNVKVGTFDVYYDKEPTSSHVALLDSLVSIANMALFRQSLIRKQAFLSAELHVAETIQKSTLPAEGKVYEFAELSYFYKPADRIGGDWFNIIESANSSKVYFLMGDVTGHGLPQGLLSTAISGAILLLERLVQQKEKNFIPSPSELMQYLNNLLLSLAGDSNIGMTCVIGLVDFENSKVSICNSNHTFPLVVNQGGETPTIKALTESGHEDGSSFYQVIEHEFGVDDYLCFYTDGLTEAKSENGSTFSRPFFRTMKNMSRTNSAHDLKNYVFDAFENFSKNTPVEDDVCVVILGHNKNSVKRLQAG